MKRGLIILVSLVVLHADVVLADCSQDGFTAVYVNGMITNESQAEVGRNAVERQFINRTGRTDVVFDLAYNPPHLGGMGDLVKSVEQAYQENGKAIDDYDLATMLAWLHKELLTRKILLIGYSQGTFYTNALYAYLTTHGVPTSAIAVYNIATPASFVAGDDGHNESYLVSSHDSVLNEVRRWATRIGALHPLQANSSLPLSEGELHVLWPGHSLTEDYLTHASDRIVKDLQQKLSGLSIEPTATSTLSHDCFTPPPRDLGYKVQSVLFGLADPVARVVVDGSTAVYGVGSMAASSTISAIVSMVDAVQSGIASISPESQLAIPMPLLNATESPSSSAVRSGSVGVQVRYITDEEPQLPLEQKPSLPTPDVLSIPPSSTPLILPVAPIFSVVPGFGGGGPPDPGLQPRSPQPQPLTAPILSIAECAYSLAASSSDPCLLSSESVSAQWGSVAGAVGYRVYIDGAVALDTASAGAMLFLPDHHTVSMQTVAYDAEGRTATSSTISVAVYTHPIVINEIAWAGTDADSSDQWVELKNLTPYRIDLSHITLASADGAINVQLSGVLQIKNGLVPPYALVYRARSPLPSGMYLGQWEQVTFPEMSSAPQQLLLTASTSLSGVALLDATPMPSACAGWCAGGLATTTSVTDVGTSVQHSLSMERTDAVADGTLPSSWASSDLYSIASAKDAHGQNIYATPMDDNSKHWPVFGWFCSPETSPIMDGGIYRPGSSFCKYLTAYVDAYLPRSVVLYRGTIGSSTQITDHFINTPISYQSDVIPSDAAPGESFFVALWPYITAQDDQDFASYFTTGSTTHGYLVPPSDHFRTVSFTLAP